MRCGASCRKAADQCFERRCVFLASERPEFRAFNRNGPRSLAQG